MRVFVVTSRGICYPAPIFDKLPRGMGMVPTDLVGIPDNLRGRVADPSVFVSRMSESDRLAMLANASETLKRYGADRFARR